MRIEIAQKSNKKVSFNREREKKLEGDIFNPIVSFVLLCSVPEMMDPCQKSPCGPHSHCHSVKGMAACSCLPGFSGAPPNCAPDDSCEASDECDVNEACFEDRCINPCEMDICGVNALCSVVNHNPMCSCASGYTGNPFKGCKPLPCEYQHFLLL